MQALKWDDLVYIGQQFCKTQGRDGLERCTCLLDGKKGGAKGAAVSRSRNHAFGKPGSMEPDSS